MKKKLFALLIILIPLSATAWTAGIIIKIQNNKLYISAHYSNIDITNYIYDAKTDMAELQIIFRGENIYQLTSIQLNNLNEPINIKYFSLNRRKNELKKFQLLKKDPKNKLLYRETKETVSEFLRMRRVKKALEKYKNKIRKSR